MRYLHIDIETYCELRVDGCGVYRYAEHPTFEVLLLAYAFDGEEVRLLDRPTRGLTHELMRGLLDPGVIKVAHNANFEITCLSAWLGVRLDPSQWECTMVGAAYLGLPLALGHVAEVLQLAEAKDVRGKALISYFCRPCRPTASNGGRERNLPEHAPDKWAAFCAYCVQDVRTERAIHDYLLRYPTPTPEERSYWVQDQRINARGITVDTELIDAVRASYASYLAAAQEDLRALTGCENPNSLPQLKAWLESRTGTAWPTLSRESLDTLPSDVPLPSGVPLPSDVRRVLELRRQCSNTSISKYDTMLAYRCADGRIRGLLQFYGANRTGRFAGRGVQVQNLKRTFKKGLAAAREAVKCGAADLLFADLPEVLSRLTRTALTAPHGHLLCVADYSAIEARVIAWMAGEEWVLEVFRTHGRIYEAAASQMFGVPIKEIGKGSSLRAKGKVATLALGYQGGANALIAMGALREGIAESELPHIVFRWRQANPRIVALWSQIEGAARAAIEVRGVRDLALPSCRLRFAYDRGYLFVRLPSGRLLSYYGAAVERGKITYMGMEQATRRWRRTSTYGGSLTENIVQAIARDCFCDAMLRMEEGYGVRILMHIHDEVVAEAPADRATATLRHMYDVMAAPPAWAPGLPLKGDGYISEFYKKD